MYFFIVFGDVNDAVEKDRGEGENARTTQIVGKSAYTPLVDSEEIEGHYDGESRQQPR